MGTTVSIFNMFEPLPVRRGEFRRNIKKQYNRLLRGMQAYALISLGIRITVTNTKAKGGKQTLIGTQVHYLACHASIIYVCLQFTGSYYTRTRYLFRLFFCQYVYTKYTILCFLQARIHHAPNYRKHPTSFLCNR